MIHWGFLIPAFIAGAATCYGVLWCLGSVYAQVMKAVEDGINSARF